MVYICDHAPAAHGSILLKYPQRQGLLLDNIGALKPLQRFAGVKKPFRLHRTASYYHAGLHLFSEVPAKS